MKVEVELHSLLNRLAGVDCEFTAEDRQVVDNLMPFMNTRSVRGSA